MLCQPDLLLLGSLLDVAKILDDCRCVASREYWKLSRNARDLVPLKLLGSCC